MLYDLDLDQIDRSSNDLVENQLFFLYDWLVFQNVFFFFAYDGFFYVFFFFVFRMMVFFF
ncbi:MAG: hypothetical protein EBY80_13175 [Actinobacteria bacterium]|nr:hypothetical protein [Actinomycetota bacterium]NDA79048.1 hypothetical protein [Actinomycetota bacterium]